MSEDWAQRQRRTNRLARKTAGYLFEQADVTPRQLYGLSKLSWITKSHDYENTSYIRSTKIPAFGDIFSRSFRHLSDDEVYTQIGSIMNDESIFALVAEQTGFTNFYNSYRNSVLVWIEDNFDALLPLYKAAYLAKNSTDRKDIVGSISVLPRIPKANHPDSLLPPENFLTPVFLMLDADIKFPLINGDKGVKALLKKLEVEKSDLITQYLSMVNLYGIGGIVDAADLDQVGDDLPDFIKTTHGLAKRVLLQDKEIASENELRLKDEGDVEAIRKAVEVKQKRIHNLLTNKLRHTLSRYTLLEGSNPSCMFDVLVRKYIEDEDLLIEVKSSTETPHVRMAVGQLFNYWYELKGDVEPNLAILLPAKPDQNCISFLEWMNVGLMWFEDEQLLTANDRLRHLASKKN